MANNGRLIIGIDFGTDSVRAVVIDALRRQGARQRGFLLPPLGRGQILRPGAKTGSASIRSTTSRAWRPSVKGALAKLGKRAGKDVAGIGIDTTGSTPCAVTRDGVPLALTKGFEENPNAMFVLWKDHTAVKEAELINTDRPAVGRHRLHEIRGRRVLLRMVLVEDPPRHARRTARCAPPHSPGWSTATGCRPS